MSLFSNYKFPKKKVLKNSPPLFAFPVHVRILQLRFCIYHTIDRQDIYLKIGTAYE